MKKIILAGCAAFAVASSAQAETFSGPYIGVEAAIEDYGSNPGSEPTVAVIGGWDFRVGDAWVLGASARATLKGAKVFETSNIPNGQIQDVDVAIEDQFGINARVGYVAADRIMLFAEGGYERFDVAANRTLRAPVCAPPTNNCIISRNDFSFKEDMWTLGAGAEWAINENLRLRGTYTYGDGDGYNRNRFALTAAVQF
jgi:opacity protein-like surface antigen